MAARKNADQAGEKLPESQVTENADGAVAENLATEPAANATETPNADGADTDKGDEEPPADDADKDGGAEPPADDAEKDGDSEPPAPEKEVQPETVKMTLRHKSHTQFYHRAGLAITKVFADYDVPAESVGKIKGDKWIEVKDSK